jgi:hypothetical protein
MAVASIEELNQTPYDVYVEYTKPVIGKHNILQALARGAHVVVGTSGLTDDDYVEIDAAARKADRGVLACGNFAITVVLLQKFAEMAARHLEHWEIIDYAKAGKVDVPSGTVRELAFRLGQVKAAAQVVPIDEVNGPKETRGATMSGTQVHAVRLPGYQLGVGDLRRRWPAPAPEARSRRRLEAVRVRRAAGDPQGPHRARRGPRTRQGDGALTSRRLRAPYQLPGFTGLTGAFFSAFSFSAFSAFSVPLPGFAAASDAGGASDLATAASRLAISARLRQQQFDRAFGWVLRNRVQLDRQRAMHPARVNGLHRIAGLVLHVDHFLAERLAVARGERLLGGILRRMPSVGTITPTSALPSTNATRCGPSMNTGRLSRGTPIWRIVPSPRSSTHSAVTSLPSGVR